MPTSALIESSGLKAKARLKYQEYPPLCLTEIARQSDQSLRKHKLQYISATFDQLLVLHVFVYQKII